MRRHLLSTLALGLFAAPVWAVTTVRATSTASGASGAIAITAPAGTTTGDVALVLCNLNGSTTNDSADNNGATPFARDLETWETTNNTYVAVFTRRVQAGDPTTWAFTNNPNSRWGCVAYAFQNPHASAIYDVSPIAATPVTSGTTINAPSLTTVTAGALHVVAAGADLAANASTSRPATYTDTGTVVNTNQAIAAAYKVIASPSATGAQTFTYTTSASAVAVSLAIRDEAAAASSPRRLLWLGFGR